MFVEVESLMITVKLVQEAVRINYTKETNQWLIVILLASVLNNFIFKEKLMMTNIIN